MMLATILTTLAPLFAGIKDSIPLLATWQTNKASVIGAENKLNLIRLIVNLSMSVGMFITVIWLTVKVVNGSIDFETFQLLVNFLDKNL